MDIGVSDDCLNGIPYEESTDSEEEIEEEETEGEHATILARKKANQRYLPA